MDTSVSCHRNTTTRALGAALLLQACTSLLSGILFLGPMTDKSDVAALMQHTAQRLSAAQTAILIDVVTALVIAWLGVCLYAVVRNQSPLWARTAVALYVVEAGILILGKLFAHGFILCSTMPSPSADAALLRLATLLLRMSEYAYALHILPFGLGALIFYGLIYRGRLLPRWLSLWGIITVIPVLIGTLLKAHGMVVPFGIMVPYAPFEFVAGAYVLARGIAGKAEIETIQAA